MIETMEQLGNLVRAGQRDFKEFGEVNAVWYDDPLDLVLFNYTQAAQFKPVHEWNWFERNARGLILDGTTGEVVARPFSKFFNYGQDIPAPHAEIVAVEEKLDGSLGIGFLRHGQFYVATRGAVFSDQAKWATAWARKHLDHRDLEQLAWDGWTLLFEIIYPANRIVVNYGDFAGLVLIGARHTLGDFEMLPGTLDIVAANMSLRRPKHYSIASFEDCLAAATSLSVNEEGWVIRMSDDTRYKIKGDAYKIAHRIMTGVTFSRVLEAVTSGEFERMIEGVPDEFLGHVRAWQREIEDSVAAIESEVVRLDRKSSLPLSADPRENRKAHAMWMQAEAPKHLHGYLWAQYDGKDLRPLILKSAFKDRPHMHDVAITEEG